MSQPCPVACLNTDFIDYLSVFFIEHKRTFNKFTILLLLLIYPPPIQTDGSVRTLAGFSTNAAKMLGTLPFNAFYDYYNANALYSDAYVEDALHATGQFAFQASPIVAQSSGSEGSVKGAAGGMMMYTIRELHEADSDKEEGIVGAHVDEAVSFYTGSIAADSKGSSVGVAQFALAEKRAADFGTQVSGSSYFKSLVNTKVFDLFNQLNAVHQDR
jgi:hypothetical protein